MIIVLSGPGGAGKGTIAEILDKRNKHLKLVRSWTTRKPRKGEAKNAYHFASERNFLKRIAENKFVEWREFMGNHYGTPRFSPKADTDYLLEIDVEGARQVRQVWPDVLLIFLEAPSLREHEKRMKERGDTKASIRERLNKSKEERELAEKLNPIWVINKDIEETLEIIEDIISEEKLLQKTRKK